MNPIEENCLTCTNRGTIISGAEGEKVDDTTKRLVDRLHEIQRQRTALNREEESIKTALEIAEVRPEEHWLERQESEYVQNQAFASMSLVETCKTILDGYGGKELSKGQVEYLAIRGGYKFSANDSRNSIEVTLRRLAADGYCEVKHARGRNGNRYLRPTSHPLLEKPKD